MTPLDLARQLVGMLEAEQAPATGASAGRETMGVQIDAEGLSKLLELSARLGLAPALVFKMALTALEIELDKGAPKRLVGKERGSLEGKR